MKRFLPLYRHLLAVKWPFALGVLLGLIYAAASGLGMPLMTKIVFPVLFSETPDSSDPYVIAITNWLGDIPQDRFLMITCLWIPAMFLVRAIAGYGNSYMLQYVGQRVLEAIRIDMFIKLQDLPLTFFKKNRSGDLLSRMVVDTEALKQVVVNASSDLIKQPATLLFALTFLGMQAVNDRSFAIALISMATVPICVVVIRQAGKRLAAKAIALQKTAGTLSASLTENLQSSLEIRAYNLQERQISLFRKQVREILSLSMKVTKYKQAISPSVEVVAALGFAVALFFGVRAGMTLDGFMAMGMALYMSYEPIKKLGMVHARFKQGSASLERMEYILHQPDSLPDPKQPVEFKQPAQSINFEGLSFAYGEDPVLHEVNVEIPIGQVVALIGPSGAGKSTFANLMPRFYDPLEGRITVDGTDLRDVTKRDLRACIAVVPQMPALFSGTIADNIRVGKLDASDQQIAEAARRARVADFISSLPEGINTQVGERGDQLSGGQRQRIAIARAFLCDAPILILDEATSALDADSEAGVQEALAELVKGRTTFIIAHRFSTISIADRILVFDEGRIIADGSHEALRDTNDIYKAMAAGHVM